MTRVQITMDDEAVSFLDSMQKKAHIDKRADSLKNALALFNWAIDKTLQGYEIVAVKEGSSVAKELSMPILDALSARAAASKIPE
jgi:hypothetical protein